MINYIPLFSKGIVFESAPERSMPSVFLYSLVEINFAPFLERVHIQTRTIAIIITNVTTAPTTISGARIILRHVIGIVGGCLRVPWALVHIVRYE